MIDLMLRLASANLDGFLNITAFCLLFVTLPFQSVFNSAMNYQYFIYLPILS